VIEGVSLFAIGVIIFVVIRVIMGAVESGSKFLEEQRAAELRQHYERQRQEEERKRAAMTEQQRREYDRQRWEQGEQSRRWLLGDRGAGTS